MAHYEWRGTGSFRDNRNDREIEPGEVAELDDHVAGPHPEFVAVDEPEETEEQADDSDEYTCVGNDGECSRSVDEEGGLCWQHSDDE